MRLLLCWLVVGLLAAAPPVAELDAQIDQRIAASSAAENENPQEAGNWIEQARQLAQTPEQHARIDAREFDHLMDRGDYPRGFELASAAIARARTVGDPRPLFLWLARLGRAQRLLGDSAGALRSLTEAVDLGPQLTDVDADLARIHSLIAVIHRTQDDLQTAVDHYERALIHAPPELRAGVLGNYGLVLMDLQRFDEARSAQRQAMAFYRDRGDRIGEASSAFNLAVIEMQTGNFEAAIPGLENALQVYAELDSKGRQANALLTLAEAHLHLGDVAATRQRLTEVEPIIAQTGNLNHNVRFHRLHMLTLAAEDRTSAALDSSQQYITLRNKLAGEAVKKDIARLEAERELARKEAELARLARDEAQAQAALEQASARLTRTRSVYLSLIAAALVLGLAAIWVLQARRRADRYIIAETEAARQAAETANALKSRLLAIASHDLKSPLRAVEASAARLARSPTDTVAVATYSTNIQNQAGRMFTLISELIDDAIMEAGALQLTCSPSLIAPVVQQALERHRIAAGTKSIRLESQFGPDAEQAVVMIDANRFDQVLDNLIDNAIKFSPTDSEVDVDLSADQTAVYITVRDQGPGFTAADLARAFQPFQPLSARPTGGENSSGLGLSIAREIVRHHGGELGIDSHPGEGAELTILLRRHHQPATSS